MADECAGVNFGEHGNLELFEILLGHLLRTPVGADARELADDQSFNVRTRGFVVFGVSTVVADLRIG